MEKKIHYCWFGGKPLPESAKQCIESWRKFFPDYEIIEWNEKNYDINKCSYSRDAYECKKWAFVSDFARFNILKKYGGIYFDTDVEVIREFDDIIANGSFIGCEETGINPGLGLGISSTEKNSTEQLLLAEIIDFYNKLHFLNPDGSMNQKTIVEYTTKIFEKHLSLIHI